MIKLPHNWDPRDYQKPVLSYLKSQGGLSKRAVSIWHRRAGKDLTGINYIAWASQNLRKGLYVHMFPYYAQGRKIVWHGRDKSGKRFLDAFPKQIVEKITDQEMLVQFKNGSSYRVIGSDNIDSVVGTNPIFILFSEYAVGKKYAEAWDYMRPILMENQGSAWFNYTPRGKNHGWTLYEMARKNPRWFCERLTVEDTKAVPLELIEREIAEGMSRVRAKQEFWCDFNCGVEGAIYAEEMDYLDQNDRITRVPYEPDLPVDTFWDVGMNDKMVTLFVQFFQNEVRIIDYHETNNKGTLYYKNMLADKRYRYRWHYGPFDFNVREFGSGVNPISRREQFKKLGIDIRMVTRTGIDDGIEQVRRMLFKTWIDAEKCQLLIDHMRNYQRETNALTGEKKDKPLHDAASHGCDGLRMLAVSSVAVLKKLGRNNTQIELINDHKSSFIG